MQLGLFIYVNKGDGMMSFLNALSIDHANMNVNNLDESVDFYSALFGFELKKDQPDQQSKIIGNEKIKLY